MSRTEDKTSKVTKIELIKYSNMEGMEWEDSKQSDNCGPNETNPSTDNESKIDKNKIRVYCIECKASEWNRRTGRQPLDMEETFKFMNAYKWTVTWIREEEVLSKEWNQLNNCLFIIDSFDGNVFEYLSARNVRIIGPLTVLYSYSTEPIYGFETIPEKPIPIFSQCMAKQLISSSGFEGKRKSDLIMKIERMCGKYSNNLVKDVNILVSDSVETLKYRAAGSWGTPVLTSEWVDHCWNHYQHIVLYSTTARIVGKYRLKMFNKLVITVSQVSEEEREGVKRLVSSNGGEYSPALKLKVQNCILLVKEPKGEKFRFAQKRGIPCLNIQWLYDSVAKGFALAHYRYAITSSPHKPNTQRSETIGPENESQTQPISEHPFTKSSQSSDYRIEKSLKSSHSDSSYVLTNISSEDIIKTIESLTKNRSNQSFLEGCDVYVVGFDHSVFQSIKAALISCCSVVYNKFNELVTHVIVGSDLSAAQMERLFEHKSPNFVTIEWLFECLRQRECLASNRFDVRNPNPKDNNSLNRPQNIPKDIAIPPITDTLVPMPCGQWNESSNTESTHEHKSVDNRMKMSDISSHSPHISNQSNHPMSEVIHNTEAQVVSEVVEWNERRDGKQMVPEKGFLFFGFDGQTTEKLRQIVGQLNAFVIEFCIDFNCVTHLVTREPTGHQKTLSAIASGVWLLRAEYLYESHRRARFVSEVEFEWGFDIKSAVNLKPNLIRLMNSAVVWRKYLSEQTAQDLNSSELKRRKLFDGWNVLLISKALFKSPFVNVLKAGNAKVVLMSSHLAERQLKTFKFAFIELNSIKDLNKEGIKTVKYMFRKQKLLRIDFISAYVLNGPNTHLTQTMNKSSIKELKFNEFESTPDLRVKRKTDETKDNKKSSKF